MQPINFITNQALSRTSGGWSGISRSVYEQLQQEFAVNYVGPVSPHSFIFEKAVSKLKRIAGLKGKFHFFSEKRLNLICELIKPHIKEGRLNFFFGQTPWIKCHFNQPYTVYLDAAFPTYMKIYSSPEKFSAKDLDRIAGLEEKWLAKASVIFWGSDWALNEAKKYYRLPEDRCITVRVGGYIGVPGKDSYAHDDNSLLFTFISLDFIKKGGWTCVKAFNIIRNKYSGSRLIIIGQRPPEEVMQMPGIEYGGLLRKTDPAEHKKFTTILADATFMIHPTVMDTMGAVIMESGYFGCPSIAPRSFGIPEMIVHNETGILVNTPFNESDFALPILKLLEQKDLYMEMRKKVRSYMLRELTWDAVGRRIRSGITQSLK